MFRSVTDSSTELLEALRSKQAQIISTTIQKFPFVLAKLDEDDDLKAGSYALIVDEAHSSQSGEAATDLKELLGVKDRRDLDLDEDDGTPASLLARLAARGRQPNLVSSRLQRRPRARRLSCSGPRARTGGRRRSITTRCARRSRKVHRRRPHQLHDLRAALPARIRSR